MIEAAPPRGFHNRWVVTPKRARTTGKNERPMARRSPEESRTTQLPASISSASIRALFTSVDRWTRTKRSGPSRCSIA